MGIFDGFAIFSDMDGTLLKHGKLSDEHLEAVRYFNANGGLFAPTTGRAESFLMENFPELPLNTYCIVRNGTTIYDPKTDRLVWRKALDTSVIDRVMDVVGRYNNILRVNFHLERDHMVFAADTPDLEAQIRALQDPIYKAVIHFEPGGALKAAEDYTEYTDFQYMCSTDFLLEISAHGTGKGVCIKLLREMLPPDTTIIGIGDYENDITLLQASDIAVAVDSDYKALQDYADYVAPPIDRHPIAWLVEQLEQGNILKK